MTPRFPLPPDHRTQRNMDMPNENMPAPAPGNPHKEVEAFECVICYEDGKGTGQITLACSHAICLGCYTKETQRVAALRQPIKCPICRKAVRLTDEITPQEREEVAALIRTLNRDTRRVEVLNETIARDTRHRDEIQHLVVERTAEVRRIARDYGILDEATAALAAGHDLGNPFVAAPAAAAAAAHALPQMPQAQPAPQMAGIVVHMPRVPQPVPAMPPPHVPMAQPQNGVRCPGCRIHRPAEDIRYRHIPMEDGTHRLKRCERCLLIAKRAAIIRWNNGM